MTSLSPKVSILIPCYNHQDYIKKALDSVIEDQYPDKEIVIVNDGSTDDSHARVKEWMEANPLVEVKLVSRENKGICVTLNELIGLADGKYYLLLASDDELCGNTISERVEILEREESNGKLLLVSDALVVDKDNTVIMQSSMSDYNRGNKAKYYSDDGIMEEVLLNPSISGATVLINRSLYNRIGLYPTDLETEDWYFFQRAASIKAILFYDVKVSLYRIHNTNTSSGSMSHARRIRHVRAIIITYKKNILFFPGIKYKAIGLFRLLKFCLVMCKLKLKA